MKKIIMLSVLSVLIIALSTTGAEAWKCQVDNPTNMAVEVKAYYIGRGCPYLTQTIPPGGSYTFDYGAFCPSVLDGKIILANGSKKNMKSTDMNGTPWPEGDCGMPSCWNTHFKICQKAGQGYAEIRDNDYSFCKN